MFTNKTFLDFRSELLLFLKNRRTVMILTMGMMAIKMDTLATRTVRTVNI